MNWHKKGPAMSDDVRGNESTTLSLLTGLPPSFSANVNAGSLGEWSWHLGDLETLHWNNSELALKASGLNTGLRYKVCASSLDHNGQLDGQ